MPEPSSSARSLPGVTSIDVAAEAWVRRIQDGLSPEGEVEFSEWLESDPRHESSFQKYRSAWQRFEPLTAEFQSHVHTPEPVAAVRSGLWWRWAGAGLAAAAVVAVGFYSLSPREAPKLEISLVLPAPLVQRTLPDGSTVELNRGAEISVAYTATGRRVSLLRGEANFQVAKNREQPFIVSAGGAEFRAVGTAFNVRYDTKAVELVVTEGKVQVATPADLAAGPAVFSLPVIEAGHGTVVSLAPAPIMPEVAALTRQELDTKLAWQPKMLDFDDAPLSEIAAEFNRRNPVRLVVRDPVIAGRRMTATFRSDNLETFVRMIETSIGVKAERLSDTEIALVAK